MLARRQWASRLYRDPRFVRAMAARWRALRREGPRRAASAAGASARRPARRERGGGPNFRRWPVLGQRLWPNPASAVSRRTYGSEVAGLRSWLRVRVAWLDRNVARLRGGEAERARWTRATGTRKVGRAGLSLWAAPRAPATCIPDEGIPLLMGGLTPPAKRRLLPVLAVAAIAVTVIATWALAAGPGGWDHLGDGARPGPTRSPRRLRARGDAGRAVRRRQVHRRRRDRQRRSHRDVERQQLERRQLVDASRSRTARSSPSPSPAARSSPGALYERGEPRRRHPRCLGRRELGAVLHRARRSGRERQGTAGRRLNPLCRRRLQDGAGIPSADYLLACDLNAGAASATTIDPAHPFSGSVKALKDGSDGTLYAGGRFTNWKTSRRRQRRLSAARRDVAADGHRARPPVAVRSTLLSAR